MLPIAIVLMAVVESHQAQVVFNADGLYLTIYVALLLNLELAKRSYYPERTGFVAQSEVDTRSWSSKWFVVIFFC